MTDTIAPMSGEERARRVRAVLDAAKRVRDPSDPLGKEARRDLPRATGLSVPNIERSLAEHIETVATDEELATLVARAGSAPRVHVVLSAHVFVGAVRAIALAVAATRDVVVRPSTREAILVPLLHRALAEQGGATGFTVPGVLDPSPGDHVHVYGRSETIATIASQCPAGVIVRGHGPGFGIAVIDVNGVDDAEDDAAARLSWDVAAFDQRGCLSPRVVFAMGPEGAARHFASRLATALEIREKAIPRGSLSDEERRDAALYRQTARSVGHLFDGASFAVGVDFDPRTLMLPPAGRHIHVARVDDARGLERLLGPYRGAITCIGVAEKEHPVSFLDAIAKGARTLLLGNMQRPPLDGPVDLRDMI
jgi:hypothetical protein